METALIVEAAAVPPQQPSYTSDWVRINQSHIGAFAYATLDPDPMHIDPEWAKAHGPFPTTILFGAQSLALLVHLAHSVGSGLPLGVAPLNYGYDRVRFIAPVPVDSELRAHFVERGREPKGAGELVRWDATLEIRGEARPALTAEWIWLLMPYTPPGAGA